VLVIPAVCSQYGGYADVPQADTSNNSSSSSASVAAAAGSGSDLKAAAAMVSIPQGHGDLCDIPAPHVFPLGVMKFKGVPVSVPGDVPAVLRYRYGDTYMIPRCVWVSCGPLLCGAGWGRLLGVGCCIDSCPCKEMQLQRRNFTATTCCKSGAISTGQRGFAHL